MVVSTAEPWVVQMVGRKAASMAVLIAVRKET